ncbi:MAG: hypothetical protein C4339_02045 [Nitrososphaerota archaeon]
MKPRDRIFWLRAAAGAAMGLLSFLIVAMGGEGLAYLSLPLILAGYLLTYYLARFILARDLPQEERNRWFSEGAGTYVVAWLFTLIVLSTLL